MAETFYEMLPPLARFADLADPARYEAVPADWFVIITDVRGSTVAVQAGRYREVNYVGAASIAAVLNATDRADLPFVFGGDGATLLVPPTHLRAARGALAELARHAEDALDLPLRVGVVPVQRLYEAGHRLALARFQAAPHYAQAFFSGSGMAAAEEWVKDPIEGSRWAVSPEEAVARDDPYAGLECRWRDVPSPAGETVTLLVEATERAEAATVYRRAVETVERIYGEGEAAHPIALSHLRLSGMPGRFTPEVHLRKPAHERRRYRTELWLRNLLGKALVGLGLKTSETDWAEYPRRLQASTDYRKFDGVLRMVLAGSTAQRERLEAVLDTEMEAGHLVYGLHVSDRAVLTCLVYERMGQQVHFVDGAEGGYTAAAKALKKRRAAADT